MTLFASAIFLSSFLLFLLQPMVSKMLLPVFGGSPSVWLTCMLFFQAMLLIGYVYVHFTRTRLSVTRQKGIHACLLAAACFFLPLKPDASDGARAAMPMLALLWALFTSIALPFAALASTAPLLQRWFSLSGLRGADRPYSLYAVSNLGSLLGLLVFPFLMEPRLSLSEQSRFATGLFVGTASLVLLCALRFRGAASTGAEASNTPGADDGPPIDASARSRWIVLAFVPSSLLLGATGTISLDIAAVPLIWVIPLALYLLTFAIAFSREPLIPHRTAARLAPLILLPLTLWISSNSISTSMAWVPLLLHLAAFFFVAMACHGELASLQPASARLTEYYVWIALGGVLGGLFNSLLAPLLFDRLVEYPIVLMLAAIITTSSTNIAPLRIDKIDLAFPVLIGAIYVLTDLSMTAWFPTLGRFAGIAGFAAMLLPAILCLMVLRRPLCFSFALGVLLMAGVFYQDYHGQIVQRSRSFFGVYKVVEDVSPPAHTLAHGSTIHGRQRFEPEMMDEPLTYYHPTGPVGQVYKAFALGDSTRPVAVVGLGAGSMAAYAEPGRRMDFYEIDPVIARIALDTRCFTYLSRSNGSLRIRLGDARLSLRDATETYGLIVLDAFSSDAIPVHLLTKEALEIYLARLSEDGILAFHISNRYLDLVPVLKNLAAHHGLFCLLQNNVKDERMLARGASTSLWMAMSRHEKPFDKAPITTGGWIMVKGSTGMRTWTDDYSPIAEIFRWK